MKYFLSLIISAVCVCVGIMPVHAEAVALHTYTYGALSQTGASIWVAPNGSDVTGTGAVSKPYLTPGAASMHAKPGDVIVLKSGTYHAFGVIHQAGTDAQPITVRPEPNGHPVFVFTSPTSSVDIAASHLHVFGLEISRPSASVASTACVRLSRSVEDVSFTDVHIHDCLQGMSLVSGGNTTRHVSIIDTTFAHLSDIAIDGSLGTCDNVEMDRVQITDVRNARGDGFGMLFGASSTHILLEESLVANVDGGSLVMLGGDPILVNVAVSSSLPMTSGAAVVFAHGGTILNSDLRMPGSVLVLSGGANYRLRGNVIQSLSNEPGSFALQVLYDSAHVGQPGALLLDGNHVMSGEGILALPATTAGIDAPLLTTMKSNTFFFSDASLGAIFTGGIFVSATSVAAATGTGIVNLGGNISVVGTPTADDLISPIYESTTVAADPSWGVDATMIFPGARLQGSGSTIYLYGADGLRHAFPNEAVYRSWFTDYSNVTHVSDDALSKISLGRNVTYRPGVRLVKVTTDPKVYAIADGQQLRWVKTEAIAQALFGPNWAKQIDDVPDAYFVNYHLGTPIESVSDYHAEEEKAQEINPSDLF